MRSRQCWRVVDAVPGHRYALARGLESLDLAMLVLGRDVCLDLVDTELAGYGFGGSAAVAGQHHHLDPALVQRPHGRSACRLDLLGYRDKTSRVDRKSVVECKSVLVRIDIGVRRFI